MEVGKKEEREGVRKEEEKHPLAPAVQRICLHDCSHCVDSSLALFLQSGCMLHKARFQCGNTHRKEKWCD